MLLPATVLIVLAIGGGLYAKQSGGRYATHSFGVAGLLLLGLLVLALGHQL